MRNSRRTSNYSKRITLSDLTHMMSMTNLVAIGVETPRIDTGWSLKKKFTKVIRMNLRMVLCQIVNHVDSCRGCVRGPLIRNTKDIL